MAHKARRPCRHTSPSRRKTSPPLGRLLCNRLPGNGRHPVPAAGIRDGRPGVVLAQDTDDLLFAEPASLHIQPLRFGLDSSSMWRKNKGAPHLPRGRPDCAQARPAGNGRSAHGAPITARQAIVKQSAERGDPAGAEPAVVARPCIRRPVRWSPVPHSECDRRPSRDIACRDALSGEGNQPRMPRRGRGSLAVGPAGNTGAGSDRRDAWSALHGGQRQPLPGRRSAEQICREGAPS